eukprot:8493769-Prorocentrum_lima.AAC.1
MYDAPGRKGKGKNKSGPSRRNPIGSDGQIMRCPTCNSECHLRRWCPQGKVTTKGTPKGGS